MNYLEFIENRVYPFHEDAGHGWLEVPMQYLKDLNILKDISGYSYKSYDGKTAYLEEDLDASVFLDKVYGTNYPLQHQHMERVDDGDHSFIRSLPSI